MSFDVFVQDVPPGVKNVGDIRANSAALKKRPSAQASAAEIRASRTTRLDRD